VQLKFLKLSLSQNSISRERLLDELYNFAGLFMGVDVYL